LHGACAAADARSAAEAAKSVAEVDVVVEGSGCNLGWSVVDVEEKGSGFNLGRSVVDVEEDRVEVWAVE